VVPLEPKAGLDTDELSVAAMKHRSCDCPVSAARVKAETHGRCCQGCYTGP